MILDGDFHIDYFLRPIEWFLKYLNYPEDLSIVIDLCYYDPYIDTNFITFI